MAHDGKTHGNHRKRDGPHGKSCFRQEKFPCSFQQKRKRFGAQLSFEFFVLREEFRFDVSDLFLKRPSWRRRRKKKRKEKKEKIIPVLNEFAEVPPSPMIAELSRAPGVSQQPAGTRVCSLVDNLRQLQIWTTLWIPIGGAEFSLGQFSTISMNERSDEDLILRES